MSSWRLCGRPSRSLVLSWPVANTFAPLATNLRTIALPIPAGCSCDDRDLIIELARQATLALSTRQYYRCNKCEVYSGA